MQSCIKVEKLISILINHANVEISRDCVLYSTYIKNVILFLIMFLSVSEIETFNEFVHSTYLGHKKIVYFQCIFFILLNE